jgi:hypothetical protein
VPEATKGAICGTIGAPGQSFSTHSANAKVLLVCPDNEVAVQCKRDFLFANGISCVHWQPAYIFFLLYN